jgi:hypothetical protein
VSGSKNAAAARNTRLWCRGKAGVRHTPVCTDTGGSYGGKWKILMCKSCSKRLDYYSSAPWWSHPDEKPPAWVVEAA